MREPAGAAAAAAVPEHSARRPVRARVALATIFLVNGAVLASWVPHIPAVKQQHGISDARLGMILLCMAAGAVCALAVAGQLVARFGSRRTTAVAAFGICLTLPLPILSPSVPLLCLALLLLGACNGLLDVSINAQAVLVEERYGRPIMSSFHGLFGLGGLIGAGTAGVVTAQGVSGRVHVVAAALVALALTVWARGALITDAGRPGAGVGWFVRPPPRLLGLGLLAFAALLAEGAMADWSAVYLHDVLASTPALAAAGFAAFSATMALGRLSGDRVVAALGPRTVLRISGALAAGGLGAALLVGEPYAGIAGLALVGLGIANVIPVLFSRAGTMPGVDAGRALAAVTAIGYCGFLAGPPLIGVIAEVTSLPLALGLVVVGCLLISVLAGRLFPPLAVTARRPPA